MKTKILTIFVIYLLIFSKGWAQTADKTACINNLTAANTLYEKAQFAEAISLLEPCIQSGQMKKNEADAYRILGLCYLQMNNEAKTNDAIAHLLKANNNYQQFPFNDPKEFTKIVNSFTVQSKLTLGIKTGFNFSFPNITQAYSIKPATLETQSGRGQFLGITGDYFFKQKTFGINAWTAASTLVFTENVIFNDIEKINFKEELKYVDIGLEFKYFPMKKARIQPYLGLGVNMLILRSAISNVVYTNSYLGTKNESSRDMEVEGFVSSIVYNGIVDFGINAKAGKGVLGLGLQHGYAFSLSNNPEARYDNLEYTLSNQWVDCDVKLNYLNVYVTYSFPLLWRVYK